jgi:hypothetical protein
MKFPYVRRKRLHAAIALHESAMLQHAEELHTARTAHDRELEALRTAHSQQADSLHAQLDSLRAQLHELQQRTKRDTVDFSAAQYRVGARITDRMHVQIEETWSNDFEVGMRGFVLVKDGVPQDLQITYEGHAPVFLEWQDRPDVYMHPEFAGYARHDRCGFLAGFRGRASHPIAIIAPGAAPGATASPPVPATGFTPPPHDEPPSLSFADFVAMANRECRSVLEIGSRVVSPGGQSTRSVFDTKVRYTGFDYYPDSNTDVVGDAHQLSSCFPPGTQFDAIFSLAVFEHLAMPWKVAMEINKLLPIGGLCFQSTPFTWPHHEMPWDFWRFSHEGLRMLFSPALGFEVLALGLNGPCRIHSEEQSGPFWGTPFQRAYLESTILVRKVRDFSPENFRWNVQLEDVLPSESCYPKPGKA